MAFRVAPAAESDLRAAAAHIADDNPAAARRWLTSLRKKFDALARMPGMGVARSDIRPGLRMLPVGNYLVLYRNADDDVEIVRVLHGARQWQDML